mgnify:CR=1 FL=1
MISFFYKSKHLTLALAIGSITLSLLFSFSLWLSYSLNQTLKLDDELLFEVTSGSNLYRVCEQFLEKELISDCLGLRVNAKLSPNLSDIKSGMYQLLPGTSLKEALDKFNSGDVLQLPFTIVEGENYFQVLEKIRRNNYLIDDLSDKSLVESSKLLDVPQPHPEGYLYPETYFFAVGTKASVLLKRAVKKQTELVNSLWQNRNKLLPLNNPYEALILASIIEKESSHNVERELVASVFYNRLKKKMRLQTDPTVIYGVWHEYNGDIKSRHLREKTPYNTYRIKGLPPTPIANPSMSSLQAVYTPADTDYLYFVADGDGQHVFSKTLKSHNKALKEYLRKLKENG